MINTLYLKLETVSEPIICALSLLYYHVYMATQHLSVDGYLGNIMSVCTDRVPLRKRICFY